MTTQLKQGGEISSCLFFLCVVRKNFRARRALGGIDLPHGGEKWGERKKKGRGETDKGRTVS